MGVQTDRERRVSNEVPRIPNSFPDTRRFIGTPIEFLIITASLGFAMCLCELEVRIAHSLPPPISILMRTAKNIQTGHEFALYTDFYLTPIWTQAFNFIFNTYSAHTPRNPRLA